jgi:hypothetical protein
MQSTYFCFSQALYTLAKELYKVSSISHAADFNILTHAWQHHPPLYHLQFPVMTDEMLCTNGQ